MTTFSLGSIGLTNRLLYGFLNELVGICSHIVHFSLLFSFFLLYRSDWFVCKSTVIFVSFLNPLTFIVGARIIKGKV